MSREVKELLDEVRRYGFTAALGSSGHYNLFHNGTRVVDDDGPVTIPSTPSDNRWKANTVARLRRARVLPYPKHERPQEPRERRLRPAKVTFTFEDAVALWAARETMVETTGYEFPLVDDLIAKIERAAGVSYE